MTLISVFIIQDVISRLYAHSQIHVRHHHPPLDHLHGYFEVLNHLQYH
jgi:hypothetical protein